MQIIELEVNNGSISGYSVEFHEEQIQNWFTKDTTRSF